MRFIKRVPRVVESLKLRAIVQISSAITIDPNNAFARANPSLTAGPDVGSVHFGPPIVPSDGSPHKIKDAL
jgi:hypothetical protein